MSRATPPRDISPTVFFTEWVPDSVRSDEARRAQLAGTVATIVFDLDEHAQGVGPSEVLCFTISIANLEVTGRVGAAADPDLRVRLDVQTWRALNAGFLSPPEAVLKRRLKLEGDLILGLKLHAILG